MKSALTCILLLITDWFTCDGTDLRSSVFEFSFYDIYILQRDRVNAG